MTLNHTRDGWLRVADRLEKLAQAVAASASGKEQ